MKHFTLYNIDNAAPSSRPVLQGLAKMIGFVPNVFAIMGNAPSALIGFAEVTKQFGATTLSATEREIVHIATSVENGCGYCVAGHTAFAKTQKVDEVVIDAVRVGGKIGDAKLDALHDFCRALVTSRGHVSGAEVEAFFDAGYTKDQLLEVILGIGEKTISNLASVALDIPVDELFKPFTWTPEVSRNVA